MDTKLQLRFADSAVNILDMYKQYYPEAEICIETPEKPVSCRIGDAIIYADGHGMIVFDAE